MSENAPETSTPETAEASPEQGGLLSQADVDRIVEERLSRERKKYANYRDVKAKADKFDELQAAQQTELERAVAKAREEGATQGRTEVLSTVGQRLVKAEFKAEAAGKVKDLDAVLEDLNLAKFLTEDGEPDSKAIKAAVARLASVAPAETTPPFNGGPRRTATTTDMNQLIRQSAGLG
ncbi:hypothetical protein [Microbispora sp. ATCC PTA-5024]|uniref:hypothetical protein n=1 Tax=Microbispora sp. ATCC PTA-5024 TaxID=316330 RepID=UPI0012EEA8C6|nr:hypothetical protein [Microbispora sp. ATCC PTA-5024]